MDSNRNTVLHVILLGVALAAILLFDFAGCKTGTDTKATEGPGETQVQPQTNAKTARLEKENADLMDRLAKLEQDNDGIQKRVKHLETLLEAALDVCPPFEPLPPPISAVVQKVDNELKCVMLSVGRDDKVSKGMRFHISRNDSYVGEVRVHWVYPKSCSASFVQIKPGMKMEIGDLAANRL